MLRVENLEKTYPNFSLKKVGFHLERGYITGFIGRNGAGKTTTLKSIMNLVHPENGEVWVDGLSFRDHEFECKQKIGFVLGAVDYYPRKKIGLLAEVTKRFYPQWDDKIFGDLIQRFDLDLSKRGNELSEGMKVKFAIALALSHRASLLILDEPTSGLDPVSRDDLIGLFQDLVAEQEITILFSTHIISDLEKCADRLVYIQDGAIIADQELSSFVTSYRRVIGTREQLTTLTSTGIEKRIIGLRTNLFGFEGMVRAQDLESESGLSRVTHEAMKLEDIMVSIERRPQ